MLWQQQITTTVSKDMLDREEMLDAIAMEAEDANRQNSKAIQEALCLLLPENAQGESTTDAFKRLTNKSPWIPFRSPESTSTATDVDNEEVRLFDLMEPGFKRATRDQHPPAHQNYHVCLR
jgi:hypothetical protein